MVTNEDVGVDAVVRDVVSAEQLAAMAALPIERRLLLAADTLGADTLTCGGRLSYGLRALSGVYSRAARSRPVGAEDRAHLDMAALECRRLALAADLVWMRAGSAEGGDRAAVMATLLAEECEAFDAGMAIPLPAGTLSQAGHSAVRYRAIAAHLAAAAGGPDAEPD